MSWRGRLHKKISVTSRPKDFTDINVPGIARCILVISSQETVALNSSEYCDLMGDTWILSNIGAASGDGPDGVGRRGFEDSNDERLWAGSISTVASPGFLAA